MCLPRKGEFLWNTWHTKNTWSMWKKGIVTDLGHCPVTPLLLMLQGKWKAQILYELCIHDTARFGLLKRMLKGITNASLTKALRELESDGLIKREQFNEIPPHVEYSLTEKGNDLQPIFYEIMNGASITTATEMPYNIWSPLHLFTCRGFSLYNDSLR